MSNLEHSHFTNHQNEGNSHLPTDRAGHGVSACVTHASAPTRAETCIRVATQPPHLGSPGDAACVDSRAASPAVREPASCRVWPRSGRVGRARSYRGRCLVRVANERLNGTIAPACHGGGRANCSGGGVYDGRRHQRRAVLLRLSASRPIPALPAGTTAVASPARPQRVSRPSGGQSDSVT
jgi:hypothetical protein